MTTSNVPGTRRRPDPIRPRRLVPSATLVAVVVAPTLLALGIPSAAAAPASDEFGYVDSTARCATPNVAVVFGATSTSRVAVCKATNGELQYRGVRIADGAKLFLTATRSGDGSYRATNDGIGYVVTAKALTVTTGGKTVRDESWVDFHGPTTAPSPASSAPTPSSPSTAPSTPVPPPPSSSPAPPAPAAPSDTTTAPLPPPLPAEVGHR